MFFTSNYKDLLQYTRNEFLVKMNFGLNGNNIEPNGIKLKSIFLQHLYRPENLCEEEW